jgi:hypothetical protein
MNPNHPVALELQEQWYKICAILIHKSGATEDKITMNDLQAFANSGLANIVAHSKGSVITLRLVSDKEAQNIAREAGGLPV